MIWKVEFDNKAAKELRKLDKQAQKTILKYLRTRIATDENPRRFGKPLSKALSGLWRYRIQKYRLICNIEDKNIIVLILHVGHRRKVYR